MRVIANVRVGKPDTTSDKPAHTRGSKEGNAPGSFEATPGLYSDPADPTLGKGTAQRSTGVNADGCNPIDPSSPNLSPP